MIKNKKDYTEKKHNKRLLLAIVLLLLAIGLTVGIVAAYFSDTIVEDGDVTTGTLNITGSYSVTLNETATDLDSITSLMPGDAIVISGSITNIGNQSAWIREKITLTSTNEELLSNISVYSANLTQANLLAGTDYSEFAVALTDGVAVSGNKVIDGTGENAQTESGEDYDYLESNAYNFSITIYFNHNATNDAQNQTFSLAIATQALQFKNNNTTEPSEAAWNTVTAIV